MVCWQKACGGIIVAVWWGGGSCLQAAVGLGGWISTYVRRQRSYSHRHGLLTRSGISDNGLIRYRPFSIFTFIEFHWISLNLFYKSMRQLELSLIWFYTSHTQHNGCTHLHTAGTKACQSNTGMWSANTQAQVSGLRKCDHLVPAVKVSAVQVYCANQKYVIHLFQQNVDCSLSFFWCLWSVSSPYNGCSWPNIWRLPLSAQNKSCCFNKAVLNIY